MGLHNPSATSPYLKVTVLFLSVLLVARLFVLLVSNVDLYADEAQYWRWSTDPDWGYYSKPPMIAWVIGLSTTLFGDSEWAVRLPAPFAHTIAAFALFLLGRQIDSPRTGTLAALGYALMPGVIVSSTVISTDGVLLPLFSLALWLLFRLREGKSGWVGALALGACIGAGFLAKYAMLYFAVGLAITVLLDPPTRRAIASAKGAAALVLAGLIVAPHIAWNAANDFSTVGHTVDNANLGGELINPENLLKFFLDQMGVFGPVGFLALLFGLAMILPGRAGEARKRDHWLLAFILPVLLIIAFQAFLSRAHANWAATAYPAASVLVASWLAHASANRSLWWVIAAISGLAALLTPDISAGLKIALALGLAGSIILAGLGFRYRPAGLLWGAIFIHATIAVLMAGILASPLSATTQLGLDNGLKRIRGWEETARLTREKAVEIGASAILVDERELWHGLDYYLRLGRPAPLIAWRRKQGIHSFSEQQPLTGEIDDNVLVASYRPANRPRMRADFARFEYIGEVDIPLGRRANGCAIVRRLVFYRATGHSPLMRDQEWEDRFEGLSERARPPCPAPTDR